MALEERVKYRRLLADQLGNRAVERENTTPADEITATR
jgi:hypothetical protein